MDIGWIRLQDGQLSDYAIIQYEFIQATESIHNAVKKQQHIY